MMDDKAVLEKPNFALVKQQPKTENDHFEDFRIDDGVSDGETDLDFNNDKLMRDQHTDTVFKEASRGKLANNKNQIVLQ